MSEISTEQMLAMADRLDNIYVHPTKTMVDARNMLRTLAAEREQQAQVMSALCITLVGKPVGVHGTRESIDALDAYLSNHTAMVAKLRYRTEAWLLRSDPYHGKCANEVLAILSAEPASPVKECKP